MKLQKLAGKTSEIFYIFIQDASATDGSGLTGLAYNTAGMTAYYIRKGGTSTAISLVTQTVDGAYSSGGFVEVDSTNMPGLYRLDVPNAVLAAGAESVIVYLQGATNMVPCPLEIQLTAVNLDDATDFGLVALDSLTAPGTSGGLVRGQDTDSLDAVADAVWDEDITTHLTASTAGLVLGTTIPGLLTTIDGIVNSILADTGTDIPTLINALNDFDPATQSVNIGAYLGTALTETSAGYLANTLSFFYDVATATKTVNDVGVAGAGLTAEEVWAYTTRDITGGTVDTCTTNTDMRGTDNAATEAKQDIIDANVDAILIDTGTTIPAQVSALNDFDPTTESVIVATNNDKTGYTISGTKTTLDSLRDFDPDTDVMENSKTFSQLWRRMKAWVSGDTTTNGTVALADDGVTERGSVSIASGNRTFTNTTDD